MQEAHTEMEEENFHSRPTFDGYVHTAGSDLITRILHAFFKKQIRNF